jgi:hypothetical protein
MLDLAIAVLNWERHCGDYLWGLAYDGQGEQIAFGHKRTGSPGQVESGISLGRSEAIRLAMEYDKAFRTDRPADAAPEPAECPS